MAMTYQTGSGFTATNNVAILWPEGFDVDGGSTSTLASNTGVVVVVTTGGREPIYAKDILDAPTMRTVLASLFVDFERR